MPLIAAERDVLGHLSSHSPKMFLSVLFLHCLLIGGNFSSSPPGEFLLILQIVPSSLQHFLTGMHYPHSGTPHWELPMLFATTGSLFWG